MDWKSGAALVTLSWTAAFITFHSLWMYQNHVPQIKTNNTYDNFNSLSQLNSNNSANLLSRNMQVAVDYIHMEPNSLRMFLHYVSNRKYYVEWGSGGSTQIAPIAVSGKAYSIEHYVPWCKKMQKDNTLISILLSIDKLEFHCVEHNQTLGAWGGPTGRANVSLIGTRYLNAVDDIVSKIKETDKSFDGILDSVFIDGRYRSGCAVKLIAEGYVSQQKSIILIHDYTVRRYRNVVEKYYDVIDKQSKYGTMIVLRPKKIDEQLKKQAQEDLNRQLYDPRLLRRV